MYLCVLLLFYLFVLIFLFYLVFERQRYKTREMERQTQRD